LIVRFATKGKQKLTTQITTRGMRITINQQSHRINQKSHSSMRHGVMYKKARIHLSLHAQTS
jgi:hypothetical protein